MSEVVDNTPSEWHFVGKAEPGFESVEEAFKNNFLEGEEVGAGLACYVDGKLVVDIEGGYKVCFSTFPSVPPPLF